MTTTREATMFIIDGEEIPGTPLDDRDDEALRVIRLEVTLCRALLALGPPAGLAAPLHARIAMQLRALPRYDATDPSEKPAASLTDDEARQASRIIRALRSLPTWPRMSAHPSSSLRSALGGYSLDLADEIDKRARRNDT
jgi:hypothetical protein